jgi:capsule biosynthesis phosphatase
MIEKRRCIVIDLDGTLCAIKDAGKSYADVAPRHDVVETLRQYKSDGFYVIVMTSRNMNTFDGNIGRINAVTARIATDWLDRHEVPYDEIHFGKPWAGHGGFYVDDRAVRPDEFVSRSYDQIRGLIGDGT